MGKDRNKYIAVVRDRKEGSYAFRRVAGKDETLKNVRKLRKSGIRGRDIDILPVKDPRPSFWGVALQVLSIACTIVDAVLYLKKKEDSSGSR